MDTQDNSIGWSFFPTDSVNAEFANFTRLHHSVVGFLTMIII